MSVDYNAEKIDITRKRGSGSKVLNRRGADRDYWLREERKG